MSTLVEAGRLASVKNRLWPESARRWAQSRLACAVLGFVFLSALGGLFSLTMMDTVGWRASLFQSLAEWWAWGALLPLIVAGDRWLPFTAKQLGKRAAAYVAGCTFITALYLYVFFFLRALMGVSRWNDLRLAQMTSMNMLGWFLWSCVIYWMIVGVLQAYRYYERYVASELRLERMEESYSRARLNALRMQLDPHFLFNALNTISSHVERDPRLTRSMIEHLGDLLRLSLESKDRQEVPLAEELAFLDHYIEIQRIRFGNQLQIEIDVAPEVRYATVPSLFLQPLVENAIRHGISRRASGGMVTVRAQAIDHSLSICVTDDGVGLPQGWSLENGSGLGLSVTRERIFGLYPDGQGQFNLRRRAEGGTAVDILLPLRIMGGDDERC